MFKIALLALIQDFVRAFQKFFKAISREEKHQVRPKVLTSDFAQLFNAKVGAGLPDTTSILQLLMSPAAYHTYADLYQELSAIQRLFLTRLLTVVATDNNIMTVGALRAETFDTLRLRRRIGYTGARFLVIAFAKK